MKLLLLADGVVGLKISEFLIENYPEDLALIVTKEINDIHLYANRNKIPVCVFKSELDILAQLQVGVDLGIMAWWPKIIKESLIEAPKKGFINTHPSLLPYNRGKNYNFWALVEESPFGVTLHTVDSGVDTGDIVAQAPINYDWLDTGESLFYKAQSSMVSLFMSFYPKLRLGDYKTKQQSKNIGSFHRSAELEFASKIELNRTYLARDLLNLLRARTFDGHPSCWFEDKNEKYEVRIKIVKVN